MTPTVGRIVSSDPLASPPRVALVTLGYPKNLVDSEVVLGLLQDSGFALTPQPDEAGQFVRVQITETHTHDLIGVGVITPGAGAGPAARVSMPLVHG
ncbi:MAG: hypothetical protein ACE5HK_01265 [Candidatus Methylomirabilales bacterium]